MTQAEIQECLLQSGVPKYVVDYVMKFEPKAWMYQAQAWGFITVMILGFSALVPLWIWFGSMKRKIAETAAVNDGALLYGFEFGASMFPLLFAIICGAGLLVGYLPFVLSEDRRAQAFASAFLNEKNRVYAVWATKVALRKPAVGVPASFVSSMLLAPMKFFIWPTIVLSLLFLILLPRDINSHTIVTDLGVRRAPILPWSNSKTQSWETVREVSLGCTYNDGSSNVVYSLHFASGSSFYLMKMRTLDTDKLSSLVAIDRKLVEQGVDFQRRQWRNQDPLHPKCLQEQNERYSDQEMDILRSLLRVGEFEGD